MSQQDTLRTSDKLRIYIAISTFHPLVGGAEKQAHAQGRMLRERGHEATIVTFRHEKQWSKRETIAGVLVIRVAGLLLGGRDKQPRVFQQALYILALLVMGWTLWRERHKYDLLHVYQLSLLALPASLACKLSGKPMIVAVRSSGPGKVTSTHDTTSLLAGPLDPTSSLLRIGAQTWDNGDLETLVRMGKPFVRYTRKVLLQIQAVVVVLSSRMKDYVANHGFLLPNTQLIPNGVDTEHFYPKLDTSSLATRAHTVVCVSKLRYEKGVDVLLQAWHLVQQQVPQARLIMVGSGPIEPQLTQMAEALGIKESVEFAGLQSDVVMQLHRANIAILPSRWEGMPNAVLEAMACGIPCIATRVSGSEDIIQPGVNGLLVEVEDYEAMAKALLTLLNDPALTQKYGQAARTTVEQRYSIEHITNIYIELYQKMVTPQTERAEHLSPSESYIS
ncbi:MAG: glycosyltransferase family 4 protein [Ktedonobacteraceae bacterium]